MAPAIILMMMVIGACRAQLDTNRAGTYGNSSEEVPAEALASWSWGCKAESERCWWHCCEGLQCVHSSPDLGILGWFCAERQPQCVEENAVCGGPNQETQSCCGDMLCDQVTGSSEMRCQKPQPQCVQEGDFCGHGSQSCCSDLQCEGLPGYAGGTRMRGSTQMQMRCQNLQPQCVQEGDICGDSNDLLSVQSCCGDGMQCEGLPGVPGSTQMRCQKPQPQCLHEGDVCGIDGLLPTKKTCCGDRQCEKLPGSTVGSQMHCQPPQPQCVQEGDVCGIDGLLPTKTCCGDRQCEQLPGSTTGSQMHCQQRGHHHAEKQLRWAPDSKYCMSVDNNVFRNGQKMQIWECKAGMGQYFDYTPTEQTTLLRSAAAPAFCVVVDGNHDENGAKVQLWQCDPSEQAQRWIMQGFNGLQGVMLKNAAFPSKCLVVNGNGGYDGDKLQIWECEGSEQFKLWTPTP